MALKLDSQQTAITTATTTTILDAPSGATVEKHAKCSWITIRNIGVADNIITVIVDVSGTPYEKDEFTLEGGEPYVLPYDIALRGTTKSLQITTSSTSAIDVDVAYTEKS